MGQFILFSQEYPVLRLSTIYMAAYASWIPGALAFGHPFLPLRQAIQYLKAPNGILLPRCLSQPLLWAQLHPSPPSLNLYIEALTPSNSVFRDKVLKEVTKLKMRTKG